MSDNYKFDKNIVNDILDEMEYVYKSDQRPWIIGYSGGKDSTVVLHLAYKMLQRLSSEERTKKIYVVSSDTMVENPIISTYLHSMVELIGERAIIDNLPIEIKLVKPDVKDTFWTNVIGRGIPTPMFNGKFRWCTDRLKIKPTGKFIEGLINGGNTEVVILIGVRKAESISRKTRIEKRREIGKLLNRHDTTKGAFVYTPIADLATSDVWDILALNNMTNAWGGKNEELIKLYSEADSGECPFAGITVENGEQAQSCGQSRFGCWICTVVKEDKSLNGFIKSGYRELIPLAEFRKYLIANRDLPENRELKSRLGMYRFKENGDVMPGPFTWEARKIILEKLLETQARVGYELITLEELKAIDVIWCDEEDLSRRELVELYYRVTGERLPWDEYRQNLYDESTIKTLKELADDEGLDFALVRDLILTTEKNKFYSNPKILKGELDKAINKQWVHHEYLKELENENIKSWIK